MAPMTSRMPKNLILLLLPAFAYAGITVHIKTSTAKNEPLVTFNGADSNVISNLEMETLKLTPSALKAAVSAHAGGSPLDVFVKSPTPWGDLYKTYNWSEVRRDTKIIGVTAMPVKTEHLTLSKQSYSNELNQSDVGFNADIQVHVENYARNNYTGKTLTVDAEYNIDLIVGFDVPIPLKLVSRFGVSGFVKQAKKIEAKGKFTMKPLQSVGFILNATKVQLDILIEYESNFRGIVTANYNPRYQGHHFWAYDVKAVMKSAAGMSSVQRSTDLVSIEYYTDAHGYVIDQDSSKILASVPAYYV